MKLRRFRMLHRLMLSRKGEKSDKNMYEEFITDTLRRK